MERVAAAKMPKALKRCFHGCIASAESISESKPKNPSRNPVGSSSCWHLSGPQHMISVDSRWIPKSNPMCRQHHMPQLAVLEVEMYRFRDN